MSIEDKMTVDERRKYLKKMQECYLQAGRKERDHRIFTAPWAPNRDLTNVPTCSINAQT